MHRDPPHQENRERLVSVAALICPGCWGKQQWVGGDVEENGLIFLPAACGKPTPDHSS